MKIDWIMMGAMVGPVLLLVAGPAYGEPKEPLLVTKMADPDPYFVPPPGERGSGTAQRTARTDDQSRLEGAMQSFGEAIGRAAIIEQQQVEARCRHEEPASKAAQQRFAWAASCRYTRR